ncbi:MAG: AEC family transporter [Acidimicrobiales bacterium]
MFEVLLEVVLPVFIVALLGAVVGWWRDVPVAPFSAMALYLLGPALVFDSMAATDISIGESVKIVGVMVAGYSAVLLAATLWSLGRGHDRSLRAAVALAATSPNAGNMGLPVAALAFGDAGLQVAIVNFVVGALIINSGGIVLASMAGGDARAALTAPLRYPYLYAAAAGLAVNALDVDLPAAIAVPADALAAAAIPIMLILLGLQLRTVSGAEDLPDTIAVNLGRLLIAPAIAWLVASAIGLDDITRGTLVVLAAMPVAVFTTILAEEFDAHPRFVAGAVVSTTLASILSLSVLISLVR